MEQAPTHSYHEFTASRLTGWPSLRPRIDLRLLVVAIAAALFGMAFSTAARHVVEAYHSLPAQTRAAVQPVAAVELPREWRGQRKAIEFEHMYRNKR